MAKLVETEFETNYLSQVPSILDRQDGKRRLSAERIRDAIRTVRVVRTGDGWVVKRIARPKVWRFGTREQAVACARALARNSSYDIVVHDRNGKITQTLTATDRLRTIASKPRRTKSNYASTSSG